MARLTPFITRNPVAAGAFGFAALGLMAFALSDLHRTEGFGTARAVAPRSVQAPEGLSVRLESLAREADMNPDQMPAWRAFSGAMLDLQLMTRRFEARVAAGEAVEEPRERATHALMFGAALSEIDRSLSPRQAQTVRRAIDRMMPTLICRGLSAS